MGRGRPVRSFGPALLRLLLFLWTCGLSLAEAVQTSFLDAPSRVGEATNPGPAGIVSVGSSNPGGLRNKEELLLEWGPGIWALSETQLSAVTQMTCTKTLHSKAKALHRQLRIHHGAAAPLRTSSTWAGSWTGVTQVSDYPSTTLAAPWTEGAFATGRLHIVQHVVNGQPITVCNVYGFASSPLFPDAKERTNRLLQDFTREVVLGRRGIRIICGDINHEFSALSEIDIWSREGWVECQDAAWMRWHQPPVPTCKHATRRDAVFLSPEAAALLESVQVFNCFADHATVVANLRMSSSVQAELRWPMPGQIPWESVDVASWQSGWTVSAPSVSDPQAWWSQFAHGFENSLRGHVTQLSGGALPANCFGRSQRVAPVPRQDPCVSLKASRPGEERLRSDFVGTEVQLWYKQLRRLQSLLHSVRAASITPGAQIYRSELWGAIVRARGFAGGFLSWWPCRLIHLQGSPACLPVGLPDLGALERIFEDFRQNFRRFERWHACRRREVLQSKYQQSKNELFRSLRKEAPCQVDTLTVQRSYQVIGSDSECGQLHVDGPIDNRGCSTWTLDGLPVHVGMLPNLSRFPLMRLVNLSRLNCSLPLPMYRMNSFVFGNPDGKNIRMCRQNLGAAFVLSWKLIFPLSPCGLTQSRRNSGAPQ